MKITGTFDVKRNPLDFSAQAVDGISLGRMSLDKKFNGDLNATSRGEMLSAMTQTQGSAGYVAIEQVFGNLGDRRGSFVLQHFGIMNRGSSSLILEVVPDSGTGELVGLLGKMAIGVDGGRHYYEFEYELPR